jgi:hypothetical protein
MTWFAGLPAAATPLWQVAQPLTRPAWLGFVEALNVLDAGGVAVVLVGFVVAAGACGVLGGNIPPLNVTVLK